MIAGFINVEGPGRDTCAVGPPRHSPSGSNRTCARRILGDLDGLVWADLPNEGIPVQGMYGHDRLAVE